MTPETVPHEVTNNFFQETLSLYLRQEIDWDDFQQSYKDRQIELRAYWRSRKLQKVWSILKRGTSKGNTQRRFEAGDDNYLQREFRSEALHRTLLKIFPESQDVIKTFMKTRHALSQVVSVGPGLSLSSEWTAFFADYFRDRSQQSTPEQYWVHGLPADRGVLLSLYQSGSSNAEYAVLTPERVLSVTKPQSGWLELLLADFAVSHENNLKNHNEQIDQYKYDPEVLIDIAKNSGLIPPELRRVMELSSSEYYSNFIAAIIFSAILSYTAYSTAEKMEKAKKYADHGCVTVLDCKH